MGTTTLYFPLVGATPVKDIQLPPFIEFGYVPTKETTTLSFPVTNSGDTYTEFVWKVPAPFRIEPSGTGLSPGEECTFTLFFEPTDAVAVSCLAVANIAGGRSLSMRVSGIAKFPYLSVDATTLDFGPVCIGTTQQRILRVTNHSPVLANYAMVAATTAKSVDRVYTIEPAEGARCTPAFIVLHYSKHVKGDSCGHQAC